MSNKFHRLLGEGELHRPERTGEGDPNNLSIFSPQDGQYYQDTATGNLWRYRASEDEWELLIEYNRATGEIVNISSEAAQNYNLQTSKVGELKTAINKDQVVTSVFAYLYTQVRKGEEIELINPLNPEQSVTFTVLTTTSGGDVEIVVQPNRSPYAFAAETPIYFDAALFNTYQSSDPTRILRAIEEDRYASVLGVVDSTISDSVSTNVISISPKTTSGYDILEDGQLLRLYSISPRAGGASQLVTVDGDQAVTGVSYDIQVQSFTPQITFPAAYSYVETPSIYSTTRIIQTSNTVSILSQTVSGQTNAIAELNTTTGTLQSSITALTEVNDTQNTAISTIGLTANSAAATANLAVQYNDEGAYVKLLAGVGGSEITLEADQINVSGVITAINDEGTTQINGSKIETGTILASALVPKYSYIIKSDTAPVTFRESGSPEEGFLQDGDVWINTAADAGRDSYVFDASDTGGNGNWIAMFTEIDGGRITTGSLNASLITTGTLNVAQVIDANAITASQINVSDLFAESIDVGNVIKSENFDSNNGFAIYSNGDAIFRDVTSFTTNNFVDNSTGVLITEARSQFNGTVYINGRPSWPRLEFQTASGNSLGVIQGADLSGSEFFIIGADQRFSVQAGSVNDTSIQMSGGGTNWIEITTDELRIVSVPTGTSASAGTGGAPPAQVAGYLTVKIDGSTKKIPYYN